MLDFNADHFAGAAAPGRPGRDAQDEEGVVYRAFPGHGLQFHPLANFAKLNSYLGANRLDEAGLLGLALIARGVPRGDSLSWEYGFQFGSGRPPWTSGMAQAVAAQAFARGQAKLGDPAFAAAARKAFRAIPGKLVRSLPEGLFIRLYSFSDLAVLNAHLQAVVSLEDYALALEDPRRPGGRRPAARERGRAAAEVRHRRLDALRARRQRVDARLPALRRLAAEADRRPQQRPVLDRLRQQVRLLRGRAAGADARARPAPAAYPRPVDGFRDNAEVSLHALEDLARDGRGRLGAAHAAGRPRRRSRSRSTPARSRPARTVKVRATDLAGNTTELELAGGDRQGGHAAAGDDRAPRRQAPRLARPRRRDAVARPAPAARGRQPQGPPRLASARSRCAARCGSSPKPGTWHTTLIARDSTREPHRRTARRAARPEVTSAPQPTRRGPWPRIAARKSSGKGA